MYRQYPTRTLISRRSTQCSYAANTYCTYVLHYLHTYDRKRLNDFFSVIIGEKKSVLPFSTKKERSIMQVAAHLNQGIASCERLHPFRLPTFSKTNATYSGVTADRAAAHVLHATNADGANSTSTPNLQPKVHRYPGPVSPTFRRELEKGDWKIYSSISRLLQSADRRLQCRL
jgi:hypothetical protein